MHYKKKNPVRANQISSNDLDYNEARMCLYSMCELCLLVLNRGETRVT